MERAEFLEPRLSSEQSRDRVIHTLLNPKPDMTNIGRSSVLDQVKGFLPKMASADADLRTALRDGLGENLNLENVKEDEKYIEMDVAVMDEGRDGAQRWTSDSESDSTPSQSENDFTSDSDISSSSSSACSSSSSSSTRSPEKRKPRKRPLVEDISNQDSKSLRKDS